MEKIIAALDFFDEEIYQIGIAQGGILSEEYNAHLKKKKAYYELATDAIYKQHSRGIIIRDRLQALSNGAIFGERDACSMDCYFQYKLIMVVCPRSGEIIVKDESRDKVLNTNVMLVDIKGIDF